MSGKILTVVVSSYNMEKFLAQCLGSLVCKPKAMEVLEVLVVNDGSTDRTSAIGHEFAANYPQTFNVIDKANGNYGSCINCGLAAARGKYVKVLDADDYFLNANVESFLAFLKSSDYDLVLSDWHDLDLEEKVINRGSWSVPKNEPSTVETFVRLHKYAMMFGLTYRVSLLRDMGYRQLEGGSYTDTEWAVLPLCKVREIGYFPEVVYSYRTVRAGQTSNLQTLKKNYGMMVRMVLDLVRQYAALREGLCDKRKKLMDERVASYAHGIYLFVLLHRVDIDLVQYDADLLCRSKDIYSCSGQVVSGRLRFALVRAWRRRSILAKLRVFTYISLVRANLWLRNAIKTRV